MAAGIGASGLWNETNYIADDGSNDDKAVIFSQGPNRVRNRNRAPTS